MAAPRKPQKLELDPQFLADPGADGTPGAEPAPKVPLTLEKLIESEDKVTHFTSGRSMAKIAAPAPAAKLPRKRNEVAKEVTIKFNTWFVVKAIEDTRLKSHRLAEIRAFMTTQGLSAVEPRWRYEAALRSYFGT